jgi:hypothetical protein
MTTHAHSQHYHKLGSGHFTVRRTSVREHLCLVPLMYLAHEQVGQLLQIGTVDVIAVRVNLVHNLFPLGLQLLVPYPVVLVRGPVRSRCDREWRAVT